MDPESAELASTAAATIVTLLTTDAWMRVKQEIGGLWRRLRPAQADVVEAELDRSRGEVEGSPGDGALAAALSAEWEARLIRLLAAEATATAELGKVASDLDALLRTLLGASDASGASDAGGAGDRTVPIEQHGMAFDHGKVIQIGGEGKIGKIMLGEERVHITPGQYAIAGGAAVIIQVGNNLYLTDPSLLAAWSARETTPGECPFPGLDAFGPGQARWFFGREDLTGDLVQELDAALREGSGDPILVVGPSGAGKSSLLGAGLLAGLASGRLPAAGAETWPRIILTPGAHPSRTLSDALTACAAAGSPAGGSAGGSAGGEASRTVIVVDQLEEVFTACPDEAERSEFLGKLAELACGTAVVVLGLRADFYARVTGYPVLRAAMGAHQIVLGAMGVTEIRDAITRPAQAAGLTLEGGLAELLLRDLGVDEKGGYEPGRLPLLAHALRATWQRRAGDQLTIAGYEATGGIGGAIARTADGVFLGLDAAGQRAARQVFLALVRVGVDAGAGEAAGDGEVEGTADTRRLVSAENLYARSYDPATARAVVSAFTAARLLSSGGQTVQITHEALLRRWPRLREWIGEDRSDSLVRQELEEAAVAWDREGRDAGGLYGGVRLAMARAWAEGADRSHELSGAASDFLGASERRRRRGVRRRNEVIAILTALSIALATLTGFAFHQRGVAESSNRNAESQLLADQYATAVSDQVPNVGMEFAVEAQRLEPRSPQALSALLSSQGLHIAGRLVDYSDASDVLATAWSPTGTLIASSARDGYVRLWDASTYRQLWATQLTTEHGRDDVVVSSVAFSPDGRILATSAEGGVQLWNIAKPAHPVSLATLSAAAGSKATALAFSPDGRTLAVGANSGSLVWLWNMTSRRTEGTISIGDGSKANDNDAVGSLAFADGGRVLATADDAGGVKLWDVARRTVTDVLESPTAVTRVGAVAVSPDGQTIAFCGQETKGLYPVVLWSLARHRMVVTLAGETDSPNSLAFSPDGTLLASGSIVGTVRLWDLLDGGALTDTLNGNSANPITHVAFSPDGGTLASSGNDATVALWNVRGNTLDGHANPAVASAFSPDGRLLAVGVDLPGSAAVVLYSMPARRKVATLETGGPFVSGLAFSPDGGELAVSGYGGPSSSTLQLWDVRSRRLTGEVNTPQPPFAVYVAFSPDGKLLATSAPEDPVVRLFSTAPLSQVTELNTEGYPPIGEDNPGVYQTAFSPDGKLLAMTGRGGWGWVADIATRTAVETLGVHGDARSVAYSPDGRTVVIGDLTGDVYSYPVLRSAQAQAPATTLTDSTQPINSIAFEPDGQTLIAAGTDGVIRLWNTAQRTLDESITEGNWPIWSVSYSAALTTIATAAPTITEVWQTDPGQVAADICRTLRAPVSKTAWDAYLNGIPYMPVCG